jgi:hypothetical protein
VSSIYHLNGIVLEADPLDGALVAVEIDFLARPREVVLPLRLVTAYGAFTRRRSLDFVVADHQRKTYVLPSDQLTRAAREDLVDVARLAVGRVGEILPLAAELLTDDDPVPTSDRAELASHRVAALPGKAFLEAAWARITGAP